MPFFPSRFKQQGTSLVETLVSIALLGGIMIPLLFVSSANFLGQLASLRENADAYQSTSYFLNKFIDTLQSTRRVLPESTNTEIYLAYYDPILDRELKVGYKIEDMGSYRILHEMVYNPATLQWTEASPYPLMEADEITLPDSVIFEYCIDANCSGNTDVSSEPERSTLVKLTGWTFTAAEQTATLPDIDIYTGTNSSGSTGGGTILSDGVRELYSFHNSTSFGNGTDLTRVSLTPDGNKFTYAALTGTPGPAGLTTIITGANCCFGAQSSALGDTSKGQVYFTFSGNNDNYGVYMWNENTGLSTIQPNSAQNGKGINSIVVDGTNRVYWGAGADWENYWGGWPNSNLYTWDEATGVSLIPTPSFSGQGAWNLCASSDRIFWGRAKSGTGLWTWNVGTGLSTIHDAVTTSGHNYWGYNGYQKNNCNSSGTYFFGIQSATLPAFVYNVSTGISTISGNIYEPGAYSSVKVAENGRIFFGDDEETNGNFYTWTAAEGLTTIGDNSFRYSGEDSIALADNDTVFFSEFDTSNAGIHTWSPATGWSTILTGVENVGYRSTRATPDGRVYFGNFGNPDRFWTWKADTGLTTIINSLSSPIEENVSVANNGRVYFGDHASLFWTYHPDTGLTTLVSGICCTGSHYANVVDKVTSRAFFAQENSTGKVWTYHPDTGLTTIASDFNTPGLDNMLYNGNRLFFGDDDGYYTYTWGSSQKSGDMDTFRIASQGNKTNETVTFELTGVTYGAAYQDINGDFYVIDEDNENLDRFSYDNADERFERINQKPLDTWASGVTAIAIDQANDGVALLHTGSDRVYTYTDRNASSGSATTHNISGVADTPTGISVSGRTGNWLIIDSDVTGSGANKKIQLHVFNNNWTFKKSIDIKVNDSAFLSIDASSETNFKIQYDDESNILYLLAPTLQRTFALALPEKL